MLPAQFTIPFIGPKAATACSSASVFDASRACVCAPSSSPSGASFSADRPCRMGCAPWLFRLRESAEPIPPAAPMMTNRVFSKLKAFILKPSILRHVRVHPMHWLLPPGSRQFEEPLADAQQHAAEYNPVQGRHCILVKQPE